MISRREVVTAGVLGSLAASSPAEGAAVEAAQSEQERHTQSMVRSLNALEDKIVELQRSVDQGLRGSSTGFGTVGAVRGTIEKYIRTSGKFPDYCDVGTSIFLDVYDWHVRQQQQINISRIADQRLAIQFMFTQLVLRWENDPGYIGVPFDR